MHSRLHKHGAIVRRLVIAIILGSAALLKIMDGGTDLRPTVPAWVGTLQGPAVTVVVIFVEGVVAVVLLSRWWVSGAWLTTVLSIAFLGYLLALIASGVDPCYASQPLVTFATSTRAPD